jgi:hypothetical protein
MMRRLPTAIVLAAALPALACGDGATPTSPTSATSYTELFTGTLSPGATAFYSFTATSAGSVAVTLASTATVRVGPAASIPLAMALGTPSGFGCSPTTSVITTPALTAQLSNSLPAGIHCVNVSEAEDLGGDVTFVVRIVHP